MEIMSASEARKNGLKFYYTGEPCARGHVTVRYSRGNACVECKKEFDKAYRDKIRGEFPDVSPDVEIKNISRDEAKKLGLKRYFTGKPCYRGHIAERYVTNSGCVDCINERLSYANRARIGNGDALHEVCNALHEVCSASHEEVNISHEEVNDDGDYEKGYREGMLDGLLDVFSIVKTARSVEEVKASMFDKIVEVREMFDSE